MDWRSSNPARAPAMISEREVADIEPSFEPGLLWLNSRSVNTTVTNSHAIGAISNTVCRFLGLVDARKIKSAPYMESRSATRLVGILCLIVFSVSCLYLFSYNVLRRGERK